MESHINANVGENVGGLLGPERLAEIRARLKSATPGPWHLIDDWSGGVGGILAGQDSVVEAWADWATDEGPSVGEDDAALIVNAPTDIAALLAHIDALAQERRDVEELARTLAVESEWVMATKKDMATQQAEVDRLRELAKELAEALWHAMDGCGEPFCRDGLSVGDYAALAKARQEGLL